MLKKLRSKKTAKKIWIMLAVLILPAFILWGSGSLIRNRETPADAGRIFGRKVSYLEYKDALDAVRNQAIMQFGKDFSEIQKGLNLENLAWERLLLLSEANKRKIKISDKEVIDLIQSYPFFQKKGRFDNAVYLEMLRFVFHTPPRIFEEQTRQNLILSRLYKDITDKLNLSEEEIKEAYRRNNEEVSLYYIAGLYSDFIKDINPSEKEIEEYFTKNSLKFKQPLSFNLQYLSITAGEDDKLIKSLALRLRKGANLVKIAKDFNLAVKETGPFSQVEPIPGIGWSPEILNLISKARVDDLLPVIQMDKNYYIIKIKEKKPPSIPDLKTIKDEVRGAFIKDRSLQNARERIEKCFRKLKEEYRINPKSVNFDRAAKLFGLVSGSTNLFKYGSYIEGIGASDTLWTAAKNLKENEFSEAASMPSGLYIVRVKSRIPIEEKKFAAEKTAFAAKLLSQKKAEYFSLFLKELKKKTQLF